MHVAQTVLMKIQGAREDIAASLSFRRWGFVLAAVILSAGCAELVYSNLDLPQRYSELVVGHIAWTYESKFQDYAGLFALVGGFLASLLLIASLSAGVSHNLGPAAVDRFHDFVLILCAPAGVWLAGLLTTKGEALGLLRVSELLILANLIFTAVLVFKGRTFWEQRTDRFFNCLHALMLSSLVLGLTVSAIGIGINRFGGLIGSQSWATAPKIIEYTGRTIVLWILLSSAYAIWSQSAVALEHRTRNVLLGAQILLPLFFLCLIPTSWLIDGSLKAGYHLTSLCWVFIGCCFLAAYVDLYRRWKSAPNTALGQGPITLVSGVCAIGVVLFLKMTPVGVPFVPSDDYHFGEVLVPWWSWLHQGLIPFWDYAPARGLVNYVPGFVSEIFLDGSPGSIEATYPFVYVAIAFIAYPALSAGIGAGPAILALLLGPYANDIGEIDLATATSIIILSWGFFRWPAARWLAVLAAISVALLLYAPGQGALTLLALAPLALKVLYGFYKDDKRKLLRFLFILLAAVAVLSLATPLGKMIFGAIRYGAEQSSVNSVAHGVNWSESFAKWDANPWLFELMRVSWLATALWSGVLIMRVMFASPSPERARALVYAIPVLIVTVLFIIRAAGRIDAGPTRLALAGNWSLSLLLPLLLFAVSHSPLKGVRTIFWLLLAGVVLPYWGGIASNPGAAFEAVPAVNFARVAKSAHDAGMDRLGVAVTEPPHLARLAAVRNLLDTVLNPDETYLDLTGRHAVYYYVNRKPPIESGSIYNLVGEKQQQRALQSLQAVKVPAVLLEADNVVHDGGPASLRSYLLYRYALLSPGYQIAKVNQQVWLIREDRVDRLRAISGVSLWHVDDSLANPLTKIYWTQDLKAVPASWGRSLSSLKTKMQKVPVAPSMSGFNSIKPLDHGEFLIEGADPYVRYDISKANLSGKDAGLLSFEFSCEDPSASPMVNIYWASSGNPEGAQTVFSFKGESGHLIVPVDSAPAWLLASKLLTLRFDIEEGAETCTKFKLQNIELMRRANI